MRLNRATLWRVTRVARITYAAAVVAVAGIVALAVVPVVVLMHDATAVPERVVETGSATSAPPAVPDLAAAHAEGGDLYDAYVYEGRLLLPPGYHWPTGAERDVVPDEAQRYAWFDWIAAHADAARGGDWQAASDLKTHIGDVPLEGEFKNDVMSLAQGGTASYDALLEMFPLQVGMKFNSFRVDLGPREYANGTVEVDAAGLMTSYTVAPGDSLYAIAQRFSVRVHDFHRTTNATIHPGDVVRLR